MPNKLKEIFVLGTCAFFFACGAPTNERGITSTTTDSTASGSAYNSYDGFAPNASPAQQSPAPVTAAASVTVDSAVTAAPGTAVPAGTAAVPSPAAAAKPAAADDSADIEKGEALISKSDCLACHKVQEKYIGPSYKDVANKYPNNSASINMLVDKIKKGGSGVWGTMPMSPHPALSDDDAKAMVRYILSLK